MIDNILQSRVFSHLDRALCSTMSRAAGVTDDDVLLALALVSWFTTRGHLCLDLEQVAGCDLCEVLHEETSISPDVKLPSYENWIKTLESSSIVGTPGDYTPLVLDPDGRLYLYRYWLYENTITERILMLSKSGERNIDMDLLTSGLDRYFPANGTPVDWQRVAGLAALSSPLSVISGGPGTGKTTTVLKILLLLLDQADLSGRNMHIVLAAPTGKAASRLMEAVNTSIDALDVPEHIRAHVPAEAYTLHRLLKITPGSLSPYNAENPLPADVVVIDESSMVDVGMMSTLLQALRPESRLILLGDRDQLASVEAGSVFGDICDRGTVHGYSNDFISLASTAAGTDLSLFVEKGKSSLADSLVVLRRSYRFDAGSGIGCFSAAVRDGDADRAIDVLRKDSYDDISFTEMTSPDVLDRILDRETSGYLGSYLRTGDIRDALNRMTDCMVLSPLRTGWTGVGGLNARIESLLQDKGLIRADRRFYTGRPVMVTGNHYSLRLFNGDMGLVHWDSDGLQRVFFRAMDGTLKSIMPVMIPEHDTVFAMTVHKSQGSEFRQVILVLPAHPSPVMTRELLYTAVSRAREKVLIAGTLPVLRSMIRTPLGRSSGLRDRIWG